MAESLSRDVSPILSTKESKSNIQVESIVEYASSECIAANAGLSASSAVEEAPSQGIDSFFCAFAKPQETRYTSNVLSIRPLGWHVIMFQSLPVDRLFRMHVSSFSIPYLLYVAHDGAPFLVFSLHLMCSCRTNPPFPPAGNV